MKIWRVDWEIQWEGESWMPPGCTMVWTAHSPAPGCANWAAGGVTQPGASMTWAAFLWVTEGPECPAAMPPLEVSGLLTTRNLNFAFCSRSTPRVAPQRAGIVFLRSLFQGFFSEKGGWLELYHGHILPILFNTNALWGIDSKPPFTFHTARLGTIFTESKGRRWVQKEMARHGPRLRRVTNCSQMAL